MPRFYSNIVRPFSNKAAAPGHERKSGSKPAASSQPPKDGEKKDEGGAK